MTHDQIAHTHLIIRADASPWMGTGHLMRSLALAQAWQDQGGKVVFITACESSTLQQRLLNEGFQVVSLEKSHPDPCDWEYTSRILAEHPSSWVALDGYHFDSIYQRWIEQANHPFLVIDDMAHLDHYYASIVLNQNPYSKNLQYSSEPHTRLLLGTKYALLRREFWQWQGWQRPVPRVARKVLVTMGGSDPENVTLKVIQALQRLDINGIEARVIVGGSNPHYKILKSVVQSSQIPIHIAYNVADMASIMAWADVAISAGGGTLWELAFMRLPSLILTIAENQELIVAELDRTGAIVNLGWHGDISVMEISRRLHWLMWDVEARVKMTDLGRQLIDGIGPKRVISEMTGLPILCVRQALPTDIEILYSWANDQTTRMMSFHSHTISWSEHQRWFEHMLRSPDTLLMIGELDETHGKTPIGLVRIDSDRVVSISLDPKYRGRRLGVYLLREALNFYFQFFPPCHLIAYIKPENQASLKMFTRVGFRLERLIEIEGQPALKYVYDTVRFGNELHN